MIEMNSFLQQQTTQRPSAAGCTDERVLRQAARDLFGRLQAPRRRYRRLAGARQLARQLVLLIGQLLD